MSNKKKAIYYLMSKFTGGALLRIYKLSDLVSSSYKSLIDNIFFSLWTYLLFLTSFKLTKVFINFLAKLVNNCSRFLQNDNITVSSS